MTREREYQRKWRAMMDQLIKSIAEDDSGDSHSSDDDVDSS